MVKLHEGTWTWILSQICEMGELLLLAIGATFSLDTFTLEASSGPNDVFCVTAVAKSTYTTWYMFQPLEGIFLWS